MLARCRRSSRAFSRLARALYSRHHLTKEPLGRVTFLPGFLQSFIPTPQQPAQAEISQHGDEFLIGALGRPSRFTRVGHLLPSPVLFVGVLGTIGHKPTDPAARSDSLP